MKSRNPSGASTTGSATTVKHVVAGLLVKDDQVLICQRTRHQTMPLKWEFPGGKIEPGEQPREALHRELEEELGIDAQVGEEVTRIRHRYKTGNAVDLRFFVVRRYNREIENRIFREVCWCPRSKLPNYDFLEADLTLVQDLSEGRILPPPQEKHD